MKTPDAKIKLPAWIAPEDGENYALRYFLMLYSGTAPTYGNLRGLEQAGYYWAIPQWARDIHPESHVTTLAAQDWIRYILKCETDAIAALNHKGE
jgi:hypothetical protein